MKNKELKKIITDFILRTTNANNSSIKVNNLDLEILEKELLAWRDKENKLMNEIRKRDFLLLTAILKDELEGRLFDDQTEAIIQAVLDRYNKMFVPRSNDAVNNFKETE
jgi:hypothetical protein